MVSPVCSLSSGAVWTAVAAAVAAMLRACFFWNQACSSSWVAVSMFQSPCSRAVLASSIVTFIFVERASVISYCVMVLSSVRFDGPIIAAENEMARKVD